MSNTNLDSIEKRIKYLKVLQDEHREIAAEMFAETEELTTTDFVIFGFLKRSLDIMDGLIVMIKRRNFTVAGALIRMQLDNVLKMNYLEQIQFDFQVSYEIFAGKRFNEIKDSHGQRLTDRRLREYAKAKIPQVDEIYEQTSKLIHYNIKSFFIATQPIDVESREIEIYIGVGNPNLKETHILEILDAAIFLTGQILRITESWINVKPKLVSGYD